MGLLTTANPHILTGAELDEMSDDPGEWVIQNAANSAVGGYLIQIARSRGLKTVNVVRRESAIDDVRQHGDELVLVDGPDLAKRVSPQSLAARRSASA